MFVKQGTDEGFVEIELKGRRGKPNLVIRRMLKSTSKSSTYTLNGQSATGREVTMRMNELNIQVGNLWCVDLLPSPSFVLFSSVHVADGSVLVARSSRRTRCRSSRR